VLTNLIANGAQAAGQGGTVTVTLAAADTGVRIRVEDTGPGIAAEAMPRIFEPFFTTKGIGKGTGLGLSVSLGIVQQHGGTLTADNLPAAEGGGARFTLDLRAHPDQEAAVAELRERAARHDGHSQHTVSPHAASRNGRPRIMVIDDEQPIRVALRRYLERAGWAVEEAPSGHTALTRLLAAPPGFYWAVITDLMMPDGTGMEVYDRLAAARPDLLSRLIISTGDTSSDAVVSFRARAARPFLDKPFEFAELEELLAHVGQIAAQATRTPTSTSPI
jgi:CheY-like chemotaxis protein